MKIIVPDYAFGSMGHALVNADVHAAVIERVAGGWLLEFIDPADKTGFLSVLGKLGVRVMPKPIDTATGRQAGTEPIV